MQITAAQKSKMLQDLIKTCDRKPLDPTYEFTVEMLITDLNTPKTASERNRIRQRLAMAVENGTLRVRKGVDKGNAVNIYWDPTALDKT